MPENSSINITYPAPHRCYHACDKCNRRVALITTSDGRLVKVAADSWRIDPDTSALIVKRGEDVVASFRDWAHVAFEPAES